MLKRFITMFLVIGLFHGIMTAAFENSRGNQIDLPELVLQSIIIGVAISIFLLFIDRKRNNNT
jgi:hypothetical protein